MQSTKHKENIFSDIVEKIQSLTPSQQRFLQEMLSHPEKVAITSQKKLLKKSFGIWAGRKDMGESIKYVNEIRKGWEARLKRING